MCIFYQEVYSCLLALLIKRKHLIAKQFPTLRPFNIDGQEARAVIKGLAVIHAHPAPDAHEDGHRFKHLHRVLAPFATSQCRFPEL